MNHHDLVMALIMNVFALWKKISFEHCHIIQHEFLLCLIRSWICIIWVSRKNIMRSWLHHAGITMLISFIMNNFVTQEKEMSFDHGCSIFALQEKMSFNDGFIIFASFVINILVLPTKVANHWMIKSIFASQKNVVIHWMIMTIFVIEEKILINSLDDDDNYFCITKKSSNSLDDNDYFCITRKALINSLDADVYF